MEVVVTNSRRPRGPVEIGIWTVIVIIVLTALFFIGQLVYVAYALRTS